MSAIEETGEPTIREQILQNQKIIDDLNGKLARKSEEVKIIQQISTEIVATLELDKILETILASMDSVLGFEHCMILLAAPGEENKLVLTASRGYTESGVGVEVPFGQGVIGVVAKKRRMMRMGNIQTQLAYQANVRQRMQETGGGDEVAETVKLPGLEKAQSQIGIPLLVQDKLVGVFAVESEKGNAFDELDGMLLSIVANQVASAIDNARLHQQETERSAELDKAVNELSHLNETLEAKVDGRTAELSRALEEVKHEKQLSEGLLNRMAPPEVIPAMMEDKLEAEKISATLMFTDLENFTEFTAGMEPDEIFSRLNHYFSWAGDIMTRYRGYLNKTNGDGTMALFGAPNGNSTHPTDAVLVGLALQNEVRDHIPLNMRIGINTGTIATGLLGPQNKGLYDVLGDAVNTASRMEGICPSAGVCISGDTYELVKPYFDIESLGEKDVKGLHIVSYYNVKSLKALENDERRVDASSRFAEHCAALAEEVGAFRQKSFGMFDFTSIQSRDVALGHNEAVAAYALALFRALSESNSELLGELSEETLMAAALLHDVGKFNIDVARLNERSPGNQERIKLRADLLENTLEVLEKINQQALAPALRHFYYFEETGGESGDADALTQLLAAADIYDALTAPKVYKGTPWRISGVLEELLHLPHCEGAERPIFNKFVEIMRPKDAAISTSTKTEVMFR
ncbi:MAG: GAF domain-containing protein [Rhodospirillaceae bacterium]|nr:GAF domain-containing protein [Rhodospirillaceae bacterium]